MRKTKLFPFLFTVSKLFVFAPANADVLGMITILTGTTLSINNLSYIYNNITINESGVASQSHSGDNNFAGYIFGGYKASECDARDKIQGEL